MPTSTRCRPADGTPACSAPLRLFLSHPGAERQPVTAVNKMARHGTRTATQTSIITQNMSGDAWSAASGRASSRPKTRRHVAGFADQRRHRRLLDPESTAVGRSTKARPKPVNSSLAFHWEAGSIASTHRLFAGAAHGGSSPPRPCPRDFRRGHSDGAHHDHRQYLHHACLHRRAVARRGRRRCARNDINARERRRFRSAHAHPQNTYRNRE